MPKLKTKSGAKKRHGLTKRTQKMKRKARGTRIMSATDAKIVLRNFLPNA